MCGIETLCLLTVTELKTEIIGDENDHTVSERELWFSCIRVTET